MPPTGGGAAGLPAVLQSMTTLQDALEMQRTEGDTPGLEITSKTGPDGTRHTIDMDDADLKTIMGSIKAYGQVVDAYQKEIDRLNTQQRQVSANPILNVLATVGGATALQDKRLPPVVRALGEASRELNPTYTELENRKLAIMGRQAEVTGQEAGLLSTIESRKAAQEERRYRSDLLAQGQADRRKVEADKVTAASQARSDARYKTALQHYDNQLQRDQGREITKQQFEAGMKAHGVSDKDRIAAAYEEYVGAAKQYREKAKSDKEEKDFRLKNSPAYMQQAEKKEMAEGLAKHIVDSVKAGKPADIDSLRQVTGAFGQFKGQVMNEINKEAKKQGLEPISESKLERIVSMESDFSKGTGLGQQRNAFDTFAQHAGMLQDVYKKLAEDQTNIPILNKGWQWILDNSGKNEKVARVRAAIEPVKGEYEAFLKNNKAPFKLEVDQINELIKPTMSIKAFMGTVSQMGETVKARWRSMEQQYKTATGFELKNAHPLSEEGRAGLAKIGIDMPGPDEQGSTGDPVLDAIRKHAGN